jgi:pimeloyl-ACP methyl ester carboxylesterase
MIRLLAIVVTAAIGGLLGAFAAALLQLDQMIGNAVLLAGILGGGILGATRLGARVRRLAAAVGCLITGAGLVTLAVYYLVVEGFRLRDPAPAVERRPRRRPTTTPGAAVETPPEEEPRKLRVQFAHGLESSPHGHKAVFLAQRFLTRTPAMDTSDFALCVEQQARTLREFQPDVLVGSSFGAAVVVELLNRGDWQGPTLLLAQAAVKLRGAQKLPKHVPVLLVHGVRDDVIPVEDSRRLARTGSRRMVKLIEVGDDHSLASLVETGQLSDLVRQAAAM